MLSGSLVVQSSTQQPQTDSFGTLKECVAKIVNGEDQQRILSLAGTGIKRGIDDINMRHVFDFGSKQASDATLTSGTSSYAVASDFFAIHEVQLINSDSEVYRTLEYIPWGQFNVLEQNQDETGTPQYWTARNTFDDETIEVYPIPDDGAASDYTLRITYYERVERPSADTDIINAPRELSDVLCTYGEYYVLLVRERESGVWAHKLREYREKLNNFRRSRDRQPTAGLQWRIQRHGGSNYNDIDDFDPLG